MKNPAYQMMDYRPMTFAEKNRVPPRFTFGSQGRWVIGAGLRLSDGPDGFDVSVKLRANFNFRRLFRSPDSKN